VWDETRVLDGYPGEFVVIARRSGSEWFLGAMNGERRRSVEIPLTFLDGVFACTSYRDGDGGKNSVDIYREHVGAEEVLEATLLPSGGLAAHFRGE
jgi:alpha-glucosidase